MLWSVAALLLYLAVAGDRYACIEKCVTFTGKHRIALCSWILAYGIALLLMRYSVTNAPLLVGEFAMQGIVPGHLK